LAAGCKGRRGPGPVNTGASAYPHDAGFTFARNRVFHGAQRVHQSSHVTHIDLTIPVGRQRTAGEKVDVRTLAANEQNFFPYSMQA
jgi:hypothetical protein